MNVPVPPVFLGEEEYGRYVVLDGRQRLTAAHKFLSNELRLEGLAVWTELNGLTYDQIKKKGFAATIERRFLPAILLTKESSPEVKYEVFDRLNTGGVIAKPMEVRNAIFPGPFNALLHELSSDTEFRRLWGIPISDDPVALERNSLYREMTDLEFVLRFFALREGTLKGMRFKDRLSGFMNAQNAEYRNDPEIERLWQAYQTSREDAAKRRSFRQAIAEHADARLFRQTLRNCLQVFGEAAFKKPETDGSTAARRSAPYADAVMQALADVETSMLTNDDVCDRVRRAFSQLFASNREFREAVSTGTNGETAIKTRIRLAKEAVRTAIRGAESNGPRSNIAARRKKR
jgi:hypothetical protein